MGYTLMILQSMNNPEIEQQNLRLCRHNKIAGLFVAISSKTENFEPFQKLERLNIPVVFFDKVPPDDIFNKVCLADEEAGMMAAQKLQPANPGFILAVLGSKQLSITQRRQKAFELYCKQHMPDTKLQVAYADNMDDAFAAVDAALQQKNRPDAIFSMSDEIMCGAIKAINHRNLKMPEDIRMITISNGFLPTLFSPEIAYVKTSGYDLGKLSFQRMKEILDGKKFVRENLLSCTFHPGGSL
jgi:LacI family transcriptional regulator